MKNTKIERCAHTVNLWWGCSEVSEILELTPEKPLILHKKQKTHFVIFQKESEVRK